MRLSAAVVLLVAILAFVLPGTTEGKRKRRRGQYLSKASRYLEEYH